MQDRRVRASHQQANGQYRDKGVPFDVGGCKLNFPGDTSLGASGKEVIMCRCYLSPTFDFEKKVDKPNIIVETREQKEYNYNNYVGTDVCSSIKWTIVFCKV